MPQRPGLLVKVSGDGKTFAQALSRSFGATALEIEPILTVPRHTVPGQSATGPAASTWLRLRIPQDAEHAWDRAHALLQSGHRFTMARISAVEAVEPDFEQEWPHSKQKPGDAVVSFSSTTEYCAFEDQNANGGKATGRGVAWNLAAGFSQLAAARKSVGTKLKKIIIAHLDTGYDPQHVTRPEHILAELQRNFVKGEGKPDDASDHTPPGEKIFGNRGHGTGTLSLLAGAALDGTTPNWPGFKDYIGGAPHAQILPIRIADWVARFTTGTMVEGFDWARRNGAHVLSMSMGGLSSQALVDAVNLAYDAGMVAITAAGNNFAGIPSPKSIVFPARLKRVLAACGVMADGRAYAGLQLGTMQGNYGPASKMDTALGAYTPNVPWAKIDCGAVVDMDGAGTSAATPQIAAAAALWLAEYWDIVSAYPEPWMRVEAVRNALFKSALAHTALMDAEETRQKLGRGVMQAQTALGVRPLDVEELRQPGRKLPPGEASWSWLNLLFGGGVSLTRTLPKPQQSMLALELTQMAQRVQAVDESIDDPERPADQIPGSACNRYLQAALDHGNPSAPLRAVLTGLLGRAAPSVPRPNKPPPPFKGRAKLPPPDRRLRVYALDPSVAKSLASVSVNQTVLSVPWDDLPLTPEPLRAGPVGEYLEVVDVDPASKRVYEPVDLNDKFVLAQDGMPPSEGDPKFHQQMVYAVGMTTIRHFERALGRRALWAPHYADDDGTVASSRGLDESEVHGGPTAREVPRLRMYPHAFRGDNAYYSPKKKALLFGYFPAQSKDGDVTAPGSMVFACLSSDIIAHEMSHALLDGLHRRFEEPSNLDVPAFHEAFADIVALFQHFTVTELVRFEIARARGQLSAASLLGGLANQFGEGMSRGGPLRNYIDPAMRRMRYADTNEPHDRGSILVFAVYEAFLNIVARRTQDLIRIGTGGSGVLPLGELHPDLVNRLTEETRKAARHVLHMCIRALDYCPAVDITFGEYLRALITADADLVPRDPYDYRVAFMEAFRNRGILPDDMRTISEESLTWNTPIEPKPPWLKDLVNKIDLRWNRDLDRSRIFALNEANRWTFWRGLRAVFKQDPSMYALFGLVPDLPRYNIDGSVRKQPAAGETTFEVFSIRPARRVAPDGSFHTDIIAVIHQRQSVPFDGKDIANGFFWFRGGATVIIDGRDGFEEIRFVIVKSSASATRLERQRQMMTTSFASPLRGLYFGGEHGVGLQEEPFAIMHASDRELDNV
jgi:subtilisin family serine protease